MSDTLLFSPEHDELRAQVRGFVEKELAPYAEEWERQGEFPKSIFSRVGELGLFGMKFPEEVGGSGPDFLADAVITEELVGCHSGGVSASLGAHKDLACLYLYNFGTSEQHQRWLRPAIEGRSVGGLAVTEPDAGSDVASLKCSAKRDGDDWIINGSKLFISNGAWADFVVVAAKTDQVVEGASGARRGDKEKKVVEGASGARRGDKEKKAAGHGGLTLFVVEKGMPGFEA
ncbi:MAG: acyl-CoA dehydrogenase family protein, partial [Actinomycetota bacterium]